MRRQADGFDPLPPQNVISLEQVVSQLGTDGPADLAGIVTGTLTGVENQGTYSADGAKSSAEPQVFGKITDLITEDVAGFIQ